MIKKTAVCKSAIAISPWILAMLPYYFRFMQCLRRYYDDRSAKMQVANAIKYLLAMIVTFCNLLYALDRKNNNRLYAWIILAVIGTLYSYYWDIKMDWGFLEGNLKQNKLLRKSTLLPTHLFFIYYLAAMINFLLRISWVLTISPTTFGLSELSSDYLLTLTSSLEIIRRTIWNFFRLENEHLNNCEKFRVTTLVPLDITPQLDERDQEQKVLAQISSMEPLLIQLGQHYGKPLTSEKKILKTKHLYSQSSRALLTNQSSRALLTDQVS